MSDVKRFMAPGPWITRELRECVQASDYDALAADNERLRKTLSRVLTYFQAASAVDPREPQAEPWDDVMEAVEDALRLMAPTDQGG